MRRRGLLFMPKYGMVLNGKGGHMTRPQRYTPGFWLPKGSPERLRVERNEGAEFRLILVLAALFGALGALGVL